MIQIILNGEPTDIKKQSTMQDLIETLALLDKRIAVEVNENLVPRSTFKQYQLQPQDQVEIVQAIGGG